jgi:hypothetical protein
MVKSRIRVDCDMWAVMANGPLMPPNITATSASSCLSLDAIRASRPSTVGVRLSFGVGCDSR